MKAIINQVNKRYMSLIISFLFIFLSFASSESAQSKVVGYFTHYRRNIYPADSLEIGNLTHVIHADAWANADGSIYTPSGFLYPALNTKVHNAGKKILLCFGSDGISTFANFGNVIANSTLRATFVNNITNFLIANNYDGADFDWESPTCAADEANFLALISALRVSFNAKSPQLLITMAVSADSYYGQWCNYESLTQYIDFYDLMGYDIHGSWIAHTGHNAPIYDGSDTHGCGSDNDGINYLSVTRGIPKSKIVLGVPFYGYEYTGATGFLSSYSTVTQLPYSQILTEVKTGGFVYHWDSASSVPYYMNTSSGKFISLDDTTSILAKANYSTSQGLGGVMIWELDNDLVSGHQPLLEVIGKTLLGNITPVVNLPAQVKLLTPANSALNQPVQLTLTWNKAAYAQSYTVQVATDINFTNLIVNASSITDTTKSITSLANNTKYYWRVQAINQYGSGTQSSTNSFTTVAAITIPGKPTQLAPLNSAINQAVSLQLKWTKVSGTTSYLVQLSRSSTFSSLDVADSSLTDSVRQVSSLLNNTIYYWRVRAKNTAGIGTWSNSFSFTTIVAIPGQPTQLAPLNSSINQAVSSQLKWTKVSGATSYLVQLSRSSTFSSLDVADSSLTDSVRQVSSLLNNTIYYWRVRAKNTGGIGTWSNTFTFTTIAAITIPVQPILVAPLNSAINQAVSLQLKWTKVSGATSYLVQLSRSNTFGSLDVADSSLTDSVRQVSSLLNNTIYYWRVRAKNTGGIGTWSNTFTFTTIAAITIPVQPILVAPLNSAINQAVSLQLKWVKVSGATSYLVQLSRSSTFSSLDVADSSLTDSVRQVSSLLNNTVYYWRVRAKNTAGIGTWSNSFSFTTIVAIPGQPTPVAPLNSAVNQAVSSQLKWIRVSGATSYLVQLSRSSTFSSLDVADSSLTDSVRQVSSLLNNTIYYWRVRAKNTAGIGTWSNSFSFTTIVAIPGQPTPVAPLNNAINQAVSSQLKWTRVSGATSYLVQLSRSSTFSSLDVADSSLTDSVRQVSSLLNNTIYYWRVRAKNTAGIGTWSNSFSFTTIVAIPGQPTPVAPLNSTINQAVSSQLKWTRVSGATSYLVQLSRSSTFSSLDVADSSLTDSVRQVSSLLNNTIYYWKVRAKNTGGIGAWSSTYTFTTIAAITIPGKPIQVAPLNSAINQAVSLQLKWTKVSGTTSYLVQLSRSSTFSSLDVADSSLTDSVRQVSSLLNNTIYYWRVRAKNTAGIGTWSNSFSFTTIVAIPGQPTQLAPLNSSINQAVSSQLKWTKVSGATSYLVQLSRSNTFGSLDVADSSLTDSVRQVSSLLNNTIYYWRVRAKNTGGIGTWSSTYTFTTIAAIMIPVQPILVAPLNSAINQAVSLQLKWVKVSGATSYLVQLSRSSTFSSLDVADSSLTDSVRQVLSLLNNTIYYWRVRAKNTAGIGTWSSTYIFTTVSLIASKPIPVYPSNGQRNISTQVTFKWNKANNSTNYTLEVAKDNLFSQIVINDTKITDTTRSATLKNRNTRFYWRVGAITSTGVVTWSDTWSFTTSLSAPYQLTAALDQPREIILSWQDSSVTTLTEYKIERNTSLDTNFVLIDSVSATQTSYIDKSVTDGILYDYRIKGVANLIESDYSNEVSIITTITAVKSQSLINTYALMQNYPNPFNPSTAITYQLAALGKVQIKVFDILGREVKTLVNDERPAGKYQVVWNATDNFGNKVTSGIYIYSLRTNSYSQSRKMILMK